MKRKTDTVIAIICLAMLILFVILAAFDQRAQAAYKAGYCVWPREEYIPTEPEETEDEPEGLVYLGKFWVTGYDACASCCGKRGVPAARQKDCGIPGCVPGNHHGDCKPDD